MLHYRVWCYVDWLEGAEIDQSSPLQLMSMSLFGSKSSYGLGLFGNGAIKHTQSCNNRLHNMLISRNYILFSLFRHGNIIQQRLQYICSISGRPFMSGARARSMLLGAWGSQAHLICYSMIICDIICYITNVI